MRGLWISHSLTHQLFSSRSRILEFSETNWLPPSLSERRQPREISCESSQTVINNSSP